MVFFNYSHSQFLAALIIGLFFPLGFPQMALNKDIEDEPDDGVSSSSMVFRSIR